jgi:hypothetical protein
MTLPRRAGDVVADILGRVDPEAYDLKRAEGRADMDDALRAELSAVADEKLRNHAAEMIRNWRRQKLGLDTGWTCPVCGAGVAPHVARCPCKGGEG